MGAAQDPDDIPKKSKRVRKLPPKNSEEYKIRREKNNDAVKKSRDKSRARASETIERVQMLKMENEKLEQQVQILSKELGILRDLFKMVNAGEASGAYNVGDGQTGAAVQSQDVSVTEIHEEDMTAAEMVIKAETEGDAASYDGILVNQEALQRDHEYSASCK